MVLAQTTYNLPLIIGHLVQERDLPNFELLLKLLDCMDTILSPKVTPGLFAQLTILIAYHNSKLCEVFPHNPLIPKHHFWHVNVLCYLSQGNSKTCEFAGIARMVVQQCLCTV